jgi:hypothetical protein
MALGPAVAGEPVETPDSTPTPPEEAVPREAVPREAALGEQPPTGTDGPAAGTANAWSWPRQRAPRIVAVVIALAFVLVSVVYVRLVAAADRPSGIGAPRHPAVPSIAPSRHSVAGPIVPSTGSRRIEAGLGQPDTASPSDPPATSGAPVQVEPTDEPSADPTDPALVPVDPIGEDDPPPAELTADVSASGRLLPPGYVGQVVVSNIGGSTAFGWRVSLSIGGRAKITSVSGATVAQVSGNTVTFAPADGTGRIPPDRSIRFQFRVRGIGVSAPRNCRVNGQPC